MNSKLISELIKNKKVIVCCGSGGVGKTTTSSALALLGSLSGKNTVVITIDPAKRLATSLGLKSLTSEVMDLTTRVNEVLTNQGQEKLQSRFYAVMPDSAQTFETFVREMAKGDESITGRILQTSIYKIFTKEFSGSNEYMAMEKLYQLYSENKYDLIILDTPPSANTRLFLEAPQMFADFFDEKIIKLFSTSGSRFFAAGFKKAIEVLEKLTGQGFISELVEFSSALFALRQEFTANLENVGQILKDQKAAFLMVTSPERLSKTDTRDFVEILATQNYPFAGFILNRVLAPRLGIDLTQNGSLETSASNWVSELKNQLPDLSPEEAEAFKQSFYDIQPILNTEKDASEFFKKFRVQAAFIPEQESDVHSIESLLKISKVMAKC